MRKLSVLWFVLSLAILETQTFSVNAVSEDYDWNVYGNTHYLVSVIVENPQLDSPFNVTVRLTLTSKDSSLDRTETRWMQVILNSVERPLHIESEKLGEEQKLVLSTPGDSWQETFAFKISSAEYGMGRGQSIEISVIYKINIDEIDTTWHWTYNHIGDNTNDPMKIILSIPLLTTPELIIVLAIAVIVSVVVTRTVYLEIKERKMWTQDRLRREAEERRKEKMIGDNFECPFCHTLYDKKLAKCPHCGAPKKIDS